MQMSDATPAFVFDEVTLRRDLAQLRSIADQVECVLLYSPKACSTEKIVQITGEYVDGFACSSAHEAQLSWPHLPGDGRIHLVSPLIKPDTLRQIGGRLDFVTANSLTQLNQIRPHLPAETQAGLRINPEISLVRDDRYDPCRSNSKLGVPLSKLVDFLDVRPNALEGLSGLHFHTNCDADDFSGLLATVRHIRDVVPRLLEKMEWINMGGGYLFNESADLEDFYTAVGLFRGEFGLEVQIEPGAAVVRRAGWIEATVWDILPGDEMPIAVLDTTVNHMPEVFEFQFEPDVLGHVEGGRHVYLLAGCTCLAGDQFGEYCFDTPLEIGSRVTFMNMGAYTLTKAHRFNGVPLPQVYLQTGPQQRSALSEDLLGHSISEPGGGARALS